MPLSVAGRCCGWKKSLSAKVTYVETKLAQFVTGPPQGYHVGCRRTRYWQTADVKTRRPLAEKEREEP